MPGEETTQVTVDDILKVEDAGDRSDDSKDSSIIEKPELLEIDNIPDKDRIVGREDHIESLAKNFRKLQKGKIADHVLEWGETGTGKTLVARHCAQRLEDVTVNSDNPIATVYLNEDPNSTYTATFRKIAQKVNAKAEDPINVPDQGLSAELYRNKKLWPVVRDEFPGGLVVILDEVDKHPEINEVLYTLSRAKSKDGVEIPVVTVGISNDTQFKGDIGSRVRSSLQPKHMTFTPYEEDKLVAILENRRDAFYDGVLDEGVIPKTAEVAAKEHGDARRALRLIRNAGEMADEEGAETVTVQHVLDADEKVEVEVFMELIEGASLDGKLLLFAITRLKKNNPDQTWFRTSSIHAVYETVAADVEVDSLSYNRALDQLNNHVTTGLLASRKVEGGDKGKHRSYSLHCDETSARRGLIRSTPELQDLMA